MRYSLRSLVMLSTVVPPVLMALWFLGGVNWVFPVLGVATILLCLWIAA
jgi:hypothetical protein